LRTLVMVAIAVTLGSFGQVSMRWGMQVFGPLGEPGKAMVVKLVQAVFTPYVFLGLALYAVSSMFWLVVLSQGKALNYVYPLVASSYVIVLILSWIFLGERSIPLTRVAGVVLICLGVVFVAKS